VNISWALKSSDPGVRGVAFEVMTDILEKNSSMVDLKDDVSLFASVNACLPLTVSIHLMR
jgi:hypothetical protein